MDKYEFNLKIDQMKSLFSEEKYEEAADIADTINWNKVKNPSALLRAGEIYEKTGRYEESKEVLLMAYDRSPIGRAIIYRLAEVAIKMKDYDSAEEYYTEFVEIAPHDNLKYVLRYDIEKSKGAPYEELIPILEELKEEEYTEEWAYELAYLYHKAGKSEKCIDACDELILWFGDGPYVERALELKMLYQPLTKAQEEKYRSFHQAKDGMTHIDTNEMLRAGEYAHEPVVIPPVDVNPERFNTVNLQEEIARGMEQIINATEKSAVADTLDTINRIVEEIPYLKIPQENTQQEQPYYETDEEIDGSLKMNFQELLSEDSDGQIRMMTNERTLLEHQITGQITIEEVLDEWEKTRRAAEAALQEAEQRKLESAKARALQQTSQLMDRLTGVIPKLDAGVTPRELLEEEYLQEPAHRNEPDVTVQEPGPVAEEPRQEQEPLDTDQFQDENRIVSEEPMQGEEEILATETESSMEDEPSIEPELFIDEESAIEPEAFVEEPSNEPVPSIEKASSESEAFVEESSIEPKTFIEEKAPSEPVPSMEEVPNEQADMEQSEVENVAIPEIPLPDDVTRELEKKKEKRRIKKDTSDSAATPIDNLTSEQKKIFTYFIPVKGMEDQLCKALTGMSRHLMEDETASRGNLIIQGGQGCGKTTLATSIIKVLQQQTGHPNDKVGKIHADALSRKDIGQTLKKVSGGCLIIEQAGNLSRQAVMTLSLLLEQDRSGILVILEDTSKGIKKLLAQDEGFAKKFTEKISVPIFTNDELVAFARAYSEELGYEIDEMAVLALYKRISNIQKLDQATTLTEVKEIVDEAIDREARGGLKKYFSILTASRYTDDDRIVLREKDFD